MPRRTLTVLPFLVVSLVTLDSACPQNPARGIWRSVPLPTSLSNAPTSQPAAGNFTGHGYPDIAFLAGNQVGLIAAPSVHSAIDPIATGATGIATLRGGGTSGRDGLAIATLDGVFQWCLGGPMVQITTGAWHSVGVGDLDSQGELDLVGIGAAPNLMLVHLRGNTSQTIEVLFPADEVIAAVVVAQWDGIGEQEICVATNHRLWIGRTNIVGLAERSLPNQGNSQLVRVAMPDYDSLAWLVTVNDEQRLMTAGKDLPGLFCDPSLQLGSVCELSSGFFEADDNADLIVTEVDGDLRFLPNIAFGTSSPGLAQFGNQPGMESFAPELPGMQLVSATLSCTWLGDLNADGLGDLVTIQNASNWVLVHRQTPWGSSFRPLLAGQFTTQDIGSTRVCTIPIDPESGRPPQATHLEILMFGAVAGTSTPLVLQPIGLSRNRYAVAAGTIPASVSFRQALTTTGVRASVGIVRWIHVVGSTTVEVFQPTRFAVAFEGMRIRLSDWHASRVHAIPNGYAWEDYSVGSNYLWRGVWDSTTQPLVGPVGGFEEPPDLPPKPPEPPTPPAPPVE